MKRYLFFLTLLFTIAAFALYEREIVFISPIPKDGGNVEMGFHYNPYEDAISVGYQEYSRPCVPADTEGKLVIPDSVQFRGRTLPVCWLSRGSFQSCPHLTEIRLPKNLKTISDLAFEGCSSLRDITSPDSVWVIFPRAFIGCTSLRRVRFLPLTPPESYNNDTFDEATYATATLVVPAAAAEAYLCNPLSYRFRYHAEELPIYNKEQP